MKTIKMCLDMYMLIVHMCYVNKYAGPSYCWAEKYDGHVACCPLLNHVEYAPMVQTDGRTSDRYIMLFIRRG